MVLLSIRYGDRADNKYLQTINLKPIQKRYKESAVDELYNEIGLKVSNEN